MASAIRMVRRLRSARLELVAGGSDDDGGDGDAGSFDLSMPEPSDAEGSGMQIWDASENAGPSAPATGSELQVWDASHAADTSHSASMIDSMVQPSQTTTEPDFGFDPSTLTPGPTPREQINAQVDIMQNYRDSASPPELYQSNTGDCFLVASLNEIASTPEGMAHLRERVHDNGDGTYGVDVNRWFGLGPTTQLTVDDPGPGGYNRGAVGDPTLRVIERAFADHYAPMWGSSSSTPYQFTGGNPTVAMRELGLSVSTGMPSPPTGLSDGPDVWSQQPTASDPYNDGRAHVLWTARGATDYGLVGNHAYSVAGSYVDPDSGQRMVVLSNPWGYRNPQPIPEHSLPSLINGYARGRF